MKRTKTSFILIHRGRDNLTIEMLPEKRTAVMEYYNFTRSIIFRDSIKIAGVAAGCT